MNLPPPLAALARMLRKDLAEIKEAIQEQVRATRDAAEAAQNRADSEKSTVVSTAPDKNFVAEVRPNDPKGHATQTSLKWATWFAAGSTFAAFIAASVYAGITYKQMRLLQTANQQTQTRWEAEHRPWVGNGEIGFQQPPVFLVFPDDPVAGRTQISFTIEIPMKNVGVSPAFHVETMLNGTMTDQIAAPPTMDSMMVSACQWADNNAKNIGGVLLPNSPETRFEQPTNFMVPIAQIIEARRIWIAICTAYSGTTAGEQLHHTKIWMASWPIDGQPTEIRRTANPTIIYYSLPITRWGVVRTEAD